MVKFHSIFYSADYKDVDYLATAGAGAFLDYLNNAGVDFNPVAADVTYVPPWGLCDRIVSIERAGVESANIVTRDQQGNYVSVTLVQADSVGKLKAWIASKGFNYSEKRV